MPSSTSISPPRSSSGHHRHIHGLEKGAKIATFDHIADADALQAVLEKNGMEARVQDERKLQRFWFAATPQAGVHVRVPEELRDDTRRFLETNQDGAAILLRAVRCPSCQSCRIEYPAMTRKNVLPTIVAHVAVALRFTRHECYCEDCHYTWVRTNPRRKVVAEY